MKPALPSLVLVMLGTAACSDNPSDCDQTRWSGWILSDVVAEENNVALGNGGVQVTDPDANHLSDATESEGSPGYYRLCTPAETEIALRITGETIHPTVWRTQTPREDGYWLYGSVFGVDMLNLATTLSQISDLADTDIAWSDSPQGALIYGMPTFADDTDQDAWSGAELTALDGNGQTGTVIAIAQDLETGAMGLAAGPTGLVGTNQVSGPIVMFIAYDLAPDPIRLIAEASDGRVAVADWMAEDGDVLSAFHLALPEND